MPKGPQAVRCALAQDAALALRVPMVQHRQLAAIGQPDPRRCRWRCRAHARSAARRSANCASGKHRRRRPGGWRPRRPCVRWRARDPPRTHVCKARAASQLIVAGVVSGMPSTERSRTGSAMPAARDPAGDRLQPFARKPRLSAKRAGHHRAGRRGPASGGPPSRAPAAPAPFGTPRGPERGVDRRDIRRDDGQVAWFAGGGTAVARGAAAGLFFFFFFPLRRASFFGLAAPRGTKCATGAPRVTGPQESRPRCRVGLRLPSATPSETGSAAPRCIGQ